MKVRLPSPSALVCAAARVAPVSTTLAIAAGRCAACGAPLAAGEPCNRTKDLFGRNFVDHASLADRGSPILCTHCVPLWNQNLMRTLSRCVVTGSAIYPFAKNLDRAWFLLNPPEPPFVMVSSDAKMQHLLWRAPVNLSRELLQVRLGNRILVIRRQTLLRAKEVHDRAASRLAQLKGTERARLFRSLDREMKDVNHGLLADDTLRYARSDAELGAYVSELRNLTPGEIWGLTTVTQARGELIAPAPLNPNLGGEPPAQEGIEQ